MRLWTLLLAAAALLNAQSTSSLHGTITDPQGAVIPAAVVTLSNPATRQMREVVTDNTGEYHFPQVMPGDYTLTVTKAGFQKTSRERIVLQVNVAATLDLQLDVGTTGETVNVTADAAPVSTTDASIGNAFSERQVRQLPLETRNVVQLLSLQPGVTSSGEVLGARRDQNNVTLDGVDVNDNQNSGISVNRNQNDGQGSNANSATPVSGFNSVLPVPLDSVQEFRVTVAGQGADEGRSSGGQVVLVTKSGTNQLHGSAYEFNRNTYFAANTWFNNRSGVDRQTLNRNQFGASLGGPIKKDRAFYFMNYERRIDASATAQERRVPTESMKQGILTFAASDGTTQTLNAAELKQVDPLHIGLNQGYLDILKKYPVGNDSSYGPDQGLNFSGFRFNAPQRLDNRAYVAKMDFILDRAAKHTLSVRGTLSNASQDQPNALAQFPGQQSASVLLNNSKGISASYTAILRPTLINNFTFGLTRQGLAQSGTVGDSFSLDGNYLESLQNYDDGARASGRILPAYNFVDTMTWTKGKHTITSGVNFRVMTNNRFSYAKSYPSYGFSTNVLVGLGEDIQGDITQFIQGRSGNSALQLGDPASAASAIGILLGLVDQTSITYQFLKSGAVLSQGLPQERAFGMREYEAFVNDTYRLSRELTLTYGLRYSNDRPPYEKNGLQVAPTVGLNQYFGERDYLGAQGVASNAMPNAYLSYNLSGPGNGKPSWYGADNNNFGPRFSLAFSPKDRGGVMQKVFGSNGVFRMGAGLLYDRFGSELITQFDQFGSFGLATTLNNAVSYNFATSPRFNGQPALQPAAPKGGFPYTPPDVASISGEFQGISPDLKTPYSMILNGSFSRSLPGKLSLEVSYAGRLSRKLLLQGDVYTPLENFKDPQSGQTWLQSMTGMRQIYNTLSAAMGAAQNADVATIANQVSANPSLVPKSAFIENLFPALTNFYMPGSATANYFYGIYGVYGGSYLDVLHAVDRIPEQFNTPGTCASRYGCYTFFAPQGSSMPTWMNAGAASYHGVTISLRRAFSKGISFDFNYALSHSIDNASAAEGGAGQDGAAIQNIFNPSGFRGSSDFDIRHLINANVVYELPLGKGKTFFNGAPTWADAIIGGWQVSSIMRFSSGLPTVVQGNYTWNTNYWLNSVAIASAPFKSRVGYDSNGNPSLFESTDASSSFADTYPGQVGTRAVLRLAPQTNFDISVAKSFKMPWEGHRLQFRAEAFNAFNMVNFIRPSLALHSSGTFGEFTDTAPPRVMQFALRYEF